MMEIYIKPNGKEAKKIDHLLVKLGAIMMDWETDMKFEKWCRTQLIKVMYDGN